MPNAKFRHFPAGLEILHSAVLIAFHCKMTPKTLISPALSPSRFPQVHPPEFVFLLLEHKNPSSSTVISQAIPAAKKFRYFGIDPDLEEKLDIMFKRVVATGNDVWIPNSGVNPPEFTEEHRSSDDECGSGDNDCNIGNDNGVDDLEARRPRRSNPDTQIVSKKRKTGKKKNGGQQLSISYVEDLVTSASSISSSIYTANSLNKSSTGYTINDALTKLSGISEIHEDSDLYYYSTFLVQEDKDREVFMGISDEKKLWWLQKRFLESNN